MPMYVYYAYGSFNKTNLFPSYFFKIRNDLKKLHNCLCQFELLPREEKQYDINLSMETLK